MSIVESDLLDRPSTARLHFVPVASTLLASYIGLLPFVVTAPILPPFALLVALGWRLLRPELWAAWVALPLGLADDLIGGAAPGTAMTLWTITFLAIDIVDAQPMWRDYWLDWGIAAIAISFCAVGSWAIGMFVGGGGSLSVMLAPTIVAILCFVPIARLCATLDHWRLAR
ncbi:MAG TPA: rod shape-determining protein MreD [Sphingomonas sp.]|nr:rod shape-determining protein MreD [Sphingomonas sp.]